MGAAAAPAAAGLALAGTGLSAYGEVKKGEGAKAGYDYGADRAERAAKYGRLQADQTDAQLREQLNITLGNIDVTRAAAHADPSSPTGAAIRAREEFIGDRDRTIKVGSLQAQALQAEADAKYLRSAGKSALMSGYLSAAGTVLKGASGGLSGMGGGGGSSTYIPNPDAPWVGK